MDIVMNMHIIMVLLIWFAAPFVELGIIIILLVVNRRKERKIRELTDRLSWRPSCAAPDMEDEDAEYRNVRVHESEESGPQAAVWTIPEVNKDEVSAPASAAPGPASAEPKPASAEPEPASAEPEPASAEPEPAIPAPGSLTSVSAPAPTPTLRIPKLDMGFCQGTAALIIGVVFVVLAGLIFATTTWHVLPSFCKVIMAAGFSALFFGASRMAGNLLKIRRTSQAFYILGSVFLFLTVLAAGYFGLLGQGFILLGESRWRVLWAGSVMTELALFSGLRVFRDRIYTQACLWGMTVSVSFLMGALNLRYSGWVNGMVYYGFLLVAADHIQKKRKENGHKGILPVIIEEDFGLFAPLHFWIFCVLIALQAAIGFGGIITGMTGGYLYGQPKVTCWSVLALGLAAAGITLMALRNRKPAMLTLHSLSLAMLFQYAGFCIPLDVTYQLLVGTVMTGGWFLAARRINNPLYNPAGGCIFTAALGGDTLLLLFMALLPSAPGLDYTGRQLAASASVILLAAVLAQWGRLYPMAREILPFVLFLLTLTGMNCLNLRYDVIVMAYLLAIALWDVIKRDHFAMGILAIGTGAQIIFWFMGCRPLPFFVLLAVYLLAVYVLAMSFKSEAKERDRRLKGSCLYCLAGVHIIGAYMAENRVMVMAWVSAAFAAEYAAEYAIAYHFDKKRICGPFWNITGLLVFLLTMAAFYMDHGLAVWNPVLCLIVFIGFYVMFYRGGHRWFHFVAALVALPVPWVVALRYGAVTENQVYGFTAVLLLLSGALFRRYSPIIRQRDGIPVTWSVDWFHVLVILDLAPMTWLAGNRWQWAYILLMSLYILQYAVLEPWRKHIFTMAALLGAAAFWRQPFIQWPQIIWLEVQLIPAALFIWLLAHIWKDEKTIPNLQTALYSLCLGILAADAFYTGNVGDALILESICLAVFLWAHVRKCIRWIRISGVVIITVALYMTKDFWLSLSWWVYLLAAGLGLIFFAAVNEMKKH